MQIRNGRESAWAQTVAENVDSYGACIVSYAEAWAGAMERSLASGKTDFNDFAKADSHIADEGLGVTGAMYGFAAKAIATYWEYGEPFRIWFNLDCAAGKGGEEANASGGIVNPAILTMRPSRV